MSDEIKSAILSEGDAFVGRTNESVESLPAASSGEGDASGAPDRVNSAAVPDHDSPSAQPAADEDIEHVSRTATSPNVEAEAEDDPQMTGKSPNEAP